MTTGAESVLETTVVPTGIPVPERTWSAKTKAMSSFEITESVGLPLVRVAVMDAASFGSKNPEDPVRLNVKSSACGIPAGTDVSSEREYRLMPWFEATYM